MHTSEKLHHSAEMNGRSSPRKNYKNCRRTWSLFSMLMFLATQGIVVNCSNEVNSELDVNRLKECSTQLSEPITSRVEEGWPFALNCDKMFMGIQDYHYDTGVETLNDTDFQCIISTNDSILHTFNVTNVNEDISSFFFAHSGTYSIPTVTMEQNGTIFYTFLASGSSCFSIAHTLIVTESKPSDVCSEVTFADDEILPRSFEDGGLYIMLCADLNKKFHFSKEEYEIKWYKGCEEISSEMKTPRDGFENSESLGDFQISKADFSSAGNYTCSVVYNGKERFVLKTNVCVKYEQYRGNPEISQISPATTKASIGKDVQLTCGGWGGTGSQLSFAIIWYKNTTNRTSDENICVEYMFFNGDSGSTDKYECDLQSNSEEARKCYSNPEAARGDQYKGLTKYNSTLTIKNFQESDIGQYVCKVVSPHPPAEIAFTVEKDSFNVLLIVLPVVVGFLLIVIICLLIFACIRSGYLNGRWKKQLQKPMNDDITKEKELPKEAV